MVRRVKSVELHYFSDEALKLEEDRLKKFIRAFTKRLRKTQREVKKRKG